MEKQVLIKNWSLLNNSKTAILIAMALLCHCYFYAQNLIPNYSFESYTACPIFPGEIYKAYPWFQPNTNFNSSDYYVDSCSSGPIDQNAKTGNAYAGIILYYDSANEYREYIEVKLNPPLISNKKYCVEFYVSLSYGSRFGIKDIQALFTIDSVVAESIIEALPYEPQIKNATDVITDTVNWTLISEEFSATGGEQFLTIGNFYKNDSTNWTVVNNAFPSHAYYYIDDVSVTLCDTTAVEEFQNSDFKIQIFPNPASSYTTVTAKDSDEIIITDIVGKKIKGFKISGSQLKVETDEFENGVYYLVLLKNSNIIITDKLVIIR